MKVGPHFRTALEALQLNLVRSMLTTLGVIIGVASLIVMVSIGAGAQSAIDKQIAALGSNMLQIQSGPGNMGGGRRDQVGSVQMLSDRDIRALRDQVPSIVAISGQINTTAPLVYGNANWTGRVEGVGAEYLEIRDWPIAAGRGLEPGDMTVGAKVAIVGQTVVRELFEGADPVGAELRIRNVPFTVVGVLEAKGQTGFGRDQDDVVLVPLAAARARLGARARSAPDAVGQIYVELGSSRDMLRAAEDIEAVLRARRQLSATDEAPFSIRNTAELIRTRTEAQATMAFLLGATSIISLIVGGIGIMNIMLVSVSERTREIGLRKAVGAARRAILSQFLLESAVLSTLGGGIGILLGATVSFILSRIAGWAAEVTAQSVILAFVFSAGTGILFGIWPARKASLLSPIEALRYE